MAYTPIMPNMKLTAQDMGVPDYMQALRAGMQGSREAAQTIAEPKNLAEALLQAQLKNAHDRTINQYLPRSEEARIGHQEALGDATRSNTGMDALRRQLLEQGVSKGEADRTLRQQMMDAFSQTDNERPGVSAEGPGVAASPSARDTFPGRFGTAKQAPTEMSVVNEGNPSLHKIDEMFNSSPLMRKMLEGQGYKQTQTTRFDPKTGTTAVITTSPSGRVTVHSTPGANQGAIGLTNAMKTQMQNIVAGVPKVDKKIDALIEARSPVNVLGYKSNEKARHNSLVKESAETYAKAKGWPNTNESIKAAMDILDRHTFESDSAYRARLKDLKRSLKTDMQEARETLNPNAKDQQSSEMVYNPATGRLE